MKDDWKLPISGALVSDDGGAVTIGRQSEDPKKPGFDVRCRIERTAPGKLSAHFTAMVDKRDVGSETVALDRALQEVALKAPPYVSAIERVGGLLAYRMELTQPSHGSSRTYFVGGKHKIYQLSFTYYDHS